MSHFPPADSFDISGSSVSSLQGFLDHVPDVTVAQALELMRAHLPGLTPSLLHNILVANTWEVAQIVIAGLTDEELKLAVRIFTIEAPYPVYRKFNDPFFDKVPWLPTPSPPSLCRLSFMPTIYCVCRRAALSCWSITLPSPSCCFAPHTS